MTGLIRPSKRAEEMAAHVTLDDVERNDTVLVLVRSGFLCRDIAPVIDLIEGMVRETAGLLDDRSAEVIRCAA